MAKYVPDIVSRRWVIISSNRTARPDENSSSKDAKEKCPFCPGNENQTVSEVYRIGRGEADKPGWEVRVIPNKYPITDFHEVVIHSPDDVKELHKLPLDHTQKVFQAYKQRYNFYREKGQVIIFCNQGKEAGASIKHPHSQIVVIPSQINLDTLKREPRNNMVEENKYFNIYCPDFSQWPYEVWIAPKEEESVFGDITDEQIVDLSDIFQKVMKRLEGIHNKNKKTPDEEFSYNFFIHPKESWYIRIIPRSVYRAGFELGTGLSVNVVDPADAAHELRGNKEEIHKLMRKIKQLKSK